MTAFPGYFSKSLRLVKSANDVVLNCKSSCARLTSFVLERLNRDGEIEILIRERNERNRKSTT